jgi:hypothetical protein
VLTQIANSVTFSTPAMEGIVREVLTAYHVIPRRGVEVGGVLLGRYDGDHVYVEDYEPVTSEHRWGPAYILSEADLRGLEETIESNEVRSTNLRAVGFYRSHTRSGAPCDDRDRGLLDRFFPDANALFLLLTPKQQETVAATYFCRIEGSLAPVAGPMPFPAEAQVELAPGLTPLETNGIAGLPHNGHVLAGEDLEPPVDDVRPRREIPPPIRRRLTAPDLTHTEDRPAYRDRRWIGALAVFVGAGAIGYWSLGLRAPREAEVPSASVTQHPVTQPPSPAVPLSPPVIKPPAIKATPAAKRPRASTPTAVVPEVHAVLEQWDQALRSGNPKKITAFYAPTIDSYFGERNVSNSDVAESLARSAARYGKTTVLQVSDIRITPMGDSRASATFRKRWQTSGRHLYSGETEERVTLSKHNGVWKISSEQETRVLWSDRSR